MKFKTITIVTLLLWSWNKDVKAQSYELSSPSKNVDIAVSVGEILTYSVKINGNMVLKPSELALTIEGHGTSGENGDVQKTNRHSEQNNITPVVREQSSTVKDVYNELVLQFKGNYSVIFRAYDDAVAYRFVTSWGEQPVKVKAETVQYTFADDYHIYFPEEESFMTHQERSYKYLKLSAIADTIFSSIPALVDIPNGPKIAVTEADLEDYAGFYLQGTGSSRLTGIFPHYPTAEDQKNDRDVYVTKRADYIAETNGNRSYPWRVMAIAEKDRDLFENQIVYKLAQPNKMNDTSWIKPGKVSWDWWNANNIYNVDFKAGVNTQTYKYYIDFAAANNLDYIILDEGWYELGDLLKTSPDINIPEIVNYGKQKGVGVILWVVWKTLDDQMHEALDQFEQWGIKGIKVDFMQRDDQWMVNYYWEVAREAAERHLLVDFHGAYKPTGLRRTYPNVITREGVKGLENDKWGREVTPEHDLRIPFIRMFAGPMDYTPGAMHNANKENFRPNFARPMSQGTRCHQLAMYVIYKSPIQMLADSPTHYMEQKKVIMDYLSAVPSVWDETKALDAKVGEYILLARRKGDTWYIGAMTNEEARDLTVDLSFLEGGNYNANIYSDGINADRYGDDYAYSTEKVSPNSQMKIRLATGGGWVAVIRPAR